jgi:LysM repeat protein
VTGPSRTLVPSDVEPTQSPPDATPEATAAGATYKVKSGDTLSSIAADHGTTWQVIAQLNKITDPSKLRVGQVLQLP